MSDGQATDESVTSTPAHTNRLIHETSPYLLQHAHNPVDWYPWGPEAFEKAKQEDKPILLSVGYAACHWCHVMAHESFEDEDIARLINELFVSIKVDREERPDLDALYMDAVQAFTGSGGWPMTVFLTPDALPFSGGTYFPPRDRHGMPGFPTVLRRVTHFYKTRRDQVDEMAQAFREAFRERGQAPLKLPPNIAIPAQARLDPAPLVEAVRNSLQGIDREHGGFGGAPKFPHPLDLDFLLRMIQRARQRPELGIDSADALSAVRLTLDAMAVGGIYDQIGGGFHRYATDAFWLVPHFEKMLYDNALLAPVYLHAWQLTGDDRYRAVCEDVLDYVLREMTDTAGGFYSTQDADSEGEEGKFYVWTPNELRAVLGDEDARVAERFWGVTEQGNFEGRNILHRAATEGDVAAALGLATDRVRDALARARQRLYAARAQRVWPGRDDKVLAAWNGLMQRAFAEAGRILDREEYIQAAAHNADFILAHLLLGEQLKRSWRGGQAKIDAYLEDYAALANALLTTYEATCMPRYVAQARALADRMLSRFWSDDANSFFDTAADHEELIGRPRELTDNVTPSGTSLATEALLRLGALTGEERYRDYAARVLLPLAPLTPQQPLAFGHLLAALDDFIGPLYEVALVGAAGDPATLAMRRAVGSRYLPWMVLAQAAPGEAEAQSTVPLLADRGLVGGQPAAYVCQGFVCRQPVTEPEALLRQLGR
jgi:uncharacterized protein YyaL (SSP411 family)